ncbi:MAG: dTMP kinase [Candidatus Peribacteraceae bacterium]|jgi:dTMP kinase
MNSTFIVFEGPDGCGTTLHTRLLAEYLHKKGLDVLQTFEPTDGPIGLQIRKMLHSGAPLAPLELQTLFCADRAWHLENRITPALQKNRIVLSDRYSPSTIAYGLALGLEEELLHKLNKNFIQPNLLFYLLPPFAVCSERMGRREQRDALEKEDLQHTVYDMYQRIARADPKAHTIDTSGEKETVASRIATIVEEHIAST